MNCPVCKHEPMVVLELNGVEIDYCFKCRGIWLDQGELELLLEGSENHQEVISSFTVDENNKEKKRRCPICSKHMQKVYSDNNKVLIDRCSKRHGLWFDGGELRQIIASTRFDKENRVLNILDEMFQAETKRI